MAYAFPPEVRQLVESAMATGRYPTEDDLLRDALDSLSAESAELQAIEAAINEWRHGDEGVPLDDAFETIRQRHQSDRIASHSDGKR